MSQKPTLWIPRKLSDNTMLRANRDYEVIFDAADQPASADQIIQISAQCDAVLPCHSEVFSKEVVAKLDPRLKIIANHSVGVDHCDLDALAKKNIIVTNTPDVLSDATAEIAMLLLLGAARHAADGDTLVRNGQWDSWSPSFMVGTQVTGKRIGIVGMGKVGKVMARRATGFDMEVHYHNRQQLPASEEGGAKFHKDLKSLLSVSDFLSLHCPSTPDTQQLLNAETIEYLPNGAIVINSARGALIDESALLNAIESKKLAAAGLDCFQQEPGGNPAFSAHKNIFMLPHIGSATSETRDAMGFRALDNLDAYFAGGDARDRVA